jgi:general L-amino acid transport system substrate-binding protein
MAIVRQVGNYAEVFQRNITPLGIERGPNRLWRDGGLLYAPPFR